MGHRLELKETLAELLRVAKLVKKPEQISFKVDLPEEEKRFFVLVDGIWIRKTNYNG
jgi:hypothetical protein